MWYLTPAEQRRQPSYDSEYIFSDVPVFCSSEPRLKSFVPAVKSGLGPLQMEVLGINKEHLDCDLSDDQS